MKAKAYETLLNNYDELRREMKGGKVFQDFTEGEITFGPTYRYERGSRIFSRKKEQSPSYTDRILTFTTRMESDIEQIGYWSAPGITTSDHTPVAALFKLPVMLPVNSKTIASNISIVSTRHKSSRSDEGYEFELKSLHVRGITRVKAHICIAVPTSKHNTNNHTLPISSKTKYSNSKYSISKCSNRGGAGEDDDEDDDDNDERNGASCNHNGHQSQLRVMHHGVSDLEHLHLRAHFSMHGGMSSSSDIGCVSEYSNTHVMGDTDDSKHVTCSWEKSSLPRLIPHCTNFAALIQRQLVISIEGYRGMFSYNVGSCAVELSSLHNSNDDNSDINQDFSFHNKALYKGGLIHGYISGIVSILKL